MADTEKKVEAKPKREKSPLVGRQAKPVVLDTTTKIDIDINKHLMDNIINTSINGGLNASAIEDFTTVSNSRDQIYQLIDVMAKDSTVSSIIRTYTEDVCEPADDGHIVWCESNDPKISKFINYLLNIMNVDKNIFKWVYSLIKYGDAYLRLYRESDYDDKVFNKDNVDKLYSTRNVLNENVKDKAKKTLEENIQINIHNSNDAYSYYVEMVADPGTMFELTKYGKTYGYIEVPNETLHNMDFTDVIGGANNIAMGNYRLKSNDIKIYQADDFVHACLEDNLTRYPENVELFINNKDYKKNTNAQTYQVKRGKSLLFDSYKIWREKTLLEDSAILNRVTRSSILRKVSVEVGDMPKEQVSQVLRRIKEMMEQKTSLSKDQRMTEYNNPGPQENFIYSATHEGKGAITVESVGEVVNVKDLADLDWWNNKFYASYGIPKQFFGWTDDGAGFNGGSSLTIISSIYAKGVKRIQNSILQAITDAINLFLLNRGLKSYLNNFTLKMKVPLTQEEKDYRENLTSRIQAISNFNGLFNDIEDKARKLTILKSLVKTLNYGDELIQQIDEEIRAAEEIKKQEAAKAEETPKEEEGGGNLDLNLGQTPANESIKKDKGQDILVESSDLTEDSATDLPKPEDLNVDKDFSENE